VLCLLSLKSILCLPPAARGRMAGGNYLCSYLLHLLNRIRGELKGLAGRSVAPARWQNYLCWLSLGARRSAPAVQRGRAALAGERGRPCRGPGVTEATGAIAVLQEIAWDCVIIQGAPGGRVPGLRSGGFKGDALGFRRNPVC